MYVIRNLYLRYCPQETLQNLVSPLWTILGLFGLSGILDYPYGSMKTLRGPWESLWVLGDILNQGMVLNGYWKPKGVLEPSRGCWRLLRILVNF